MIMASPVLNVLFSIGYDPDIARNCRKPIRYCIHQEPFFQQRNNGRLLLMLAVPSWLAARHCETSIIEPTIPSVPNLLLLPP